MSETLYVDQWLYTTFTGNAPLNTAVGGRFYADLVPENTEYPVVTFTLAGAHDVQGQGTFRIMTNTTFQVKVIGQTRSYWDIRPIYRMIDDLIHGKGADTSNAHIFACSRYEEFRMAEFTSGRDYRHLGGLYEVLVQRI